MWKLKQASVKENSGVATVSFTSLSIVDQIIRDFKKIHQNQKFFLDKQLVVGGWKLEKAPMASDICFKNLNTKFKHQIWRTLGIYVMLILISFGVITLITLLDKWFKGKETTDNISFWSAALAYITPFLIFIFSNFAIPYLIHLVIRFERSELKSKRESSTLNKNFIFILLNSVIVPIFNITVIYQIMEGGGSEMIISKLSNSTEFILRYLISMTFLSNTFNLFFLPIYYKGKYEKF